MASAEGGAARPDNNLRGPFGGEALLMAQRSASPAPLDKEDKDAADAATVSQKKKQGRKAGKERRDAAYGQDGNQKEEHAEKQKDTRTEATAVSEKKKTQNVPKGPKGRPTFKDLKSVEDFDDDFFIGKLAKQSFMSCILFSAGSEGMRCARLLLQFYFQMDWFFWLIVLVFGWIVWLTSLNDRFF